MFHSLLRYGNSSCIKGLRNLTSHSEVSMGLNATDTTGESYC